MKIVFLAIFFRAFTYEKQALHVPQKAVYFPSTFFPVFLHFTRSVNTPPKRVFYRLAESGRKVHNMLRCLFGNAR